MSLSYDTFSTPAGPFSAAVDATDAVVATAFGELTALAARLGADRRSFTRDPARLAAVRRQVDEYFSGERDSFTVAVAAAGTAFQQSVWRALTEIPVGETRTYGQLAAALGRPGAARAVGRANATNPVCLLIPCHRVIGSDGSLTGFAFGEAIKQQLLDREHATVPSA